MSVTKDYHLFHLLLRSVSCYRLSHLSNSLTLAQEVSAKEPAKDPEPVKAMFVDLGTQAPKGYCWSNDPGEMDLETYFNPAKPNIGDAFALDGLRPVLKDLDSETYLLTDRQNKFYLWAADDGRMFKYKDELELTTMEKAVHEVLSGIKWGNLVQQFNRNY